MTSRHSRMPSDVDRDHPLPPTGLSRATPIMPLGMPSMTKEAKESKEQAAAWEASLNRILQTMHGDDTARLLAYFKARIEIEDTYSRGLEKLASLQVNARGSRATTNTTNARDGEKGAGGYGNSGGQGNNISAEPDEIPTTLHQAYEALTDMTLQASRLRQPFIRLIKNLAGALAGVKESHEKLRKTQKENTKPVFQLYAEQRLVTVPRAKRNYEQRCRDVEQVSSMEDGDHLPVRERLKNLASTSGAAGRIAKCKRDMEDADGEYKTAVDNLEVFRLQREMRFDTAYKTMQSVIEERGTKCQRCLEAYVNGEREQIAKMTEEIDRFSVVINCMKPVGDMEQLSMSFTKDINSHPKPVLYESLNKPAPESIFGMSLQQYVDKHRHPIPLVIVKCSEAIDRAGLNREGIYRVSGRHAQIMNLKRMFDTDEEGVDFTNPPFSEDCTSISAVLKIYLRELPQPLFPFSLNERIAYSAIPDRNTRLGELKGRLKALPGCNIDTLQFLIEHLRRIYDHVETNKMTLDNLSMIFTPAIFHDFNSAMVPGAHQQGNQQSNNNQSGGGGGGPGALSFATSQTSLSTSSPSSPNPNAAPWNSYPFPPAATGSDQTSKTGQRQQQQQLYPQNQALGLNHNSGPGAPGAPGGATAAATGRTSPMPTTAPEGSSSVHSLPLPQQNPQSQLYGTSPQHSGMVAAATSPPTSGISGGGSGFTASAATTTSTAASWSNDLVLSDLILNSTSVFNVLPKLPARTNSVYSMGGSSIYSNSDDRHLSVAMSGTTLSGGVGGGSGGLGSIGNNGISTARPFSNSRQSSASSLGVPSSPIDGSGQLRPRMDSLPNIAATAAAVRSTRESEPSPPPQQRQAVQQQQQYQYHQSPKQQHQQQYQQQQQPYQQQQQQQQYQLPTPQPQQHGYTEQRQNSPPSRRPQPTFDPQQQQQQQ